MKRHNALSNSREPLKVRPLSPFGLGVVFLLFSPPSWPLDLLESYRLALQHDRQYRIAQARTKAEEEAVPQAMSQLLPSVSAVIGRNRVDQEIVRDAQSSHPPRFPSESDVVQLRQPILRLRSAFALQQARQQVKGARADLERERLAVGIRVASAYFEALLSRDRLALLAAQRRNIETRSIAAQRALDAGTGVRTDIDEANAQLDKLRAQEIGIMQSIRVTNAQLEVLIGQSVEAIATVDPTRMTPELFDPGEIETLLELAMEKSPDILARASDLEAARAAVKAARADHLPALDFVANYSRNFSDNPFFVGQEVTSNSYGIQLTIPIYQGGLTQSRVRAAVANSEEARERYQNSINNAQVQLRKEYMAVKEGIAQFRAFQKALTSAQQAVLSNQKGVFAGTRTALDVLFVEQQLYQVELDFARSRYEMLAAWVRLNSLIGTTDEEEFERLNQLLSGASVKS
jgi:outer membrane protein/protease secretion system outer membrane protein